MSSLTQTINLQPFNISRPEKIRWTFVLENNSVLSSIRSKSISKFLSQSDEVLQANNISMEYKPINREAFTSWLEYYRPRMEQKNYDILATIEWFDQKPLEGKVVEGLFFYINNQLIGSGIIARKDTQTASLAFKASDPIEVTNKKNGSVGALIDYYFVKLMVEKNVSLISGGRSVNAFGVLTSEGYLEYKTKFYTPSPAKNTQLLSSVPIADKKRVLFYGLKDDQLVLFDLQSKDTDSLNQELRFAVPGIPYQIINYDQSQLSE